MTQSAMITVMVKAVRAGSKGLMRDFGEIDRLQISKKGVANFVTSADLRTEKAIIGELMRARPKFGFLAEEAGVIEGKDPTLRFVLDPIDGTTNFIHAVPYMCISLSAEKKNEQGVWETFAAVIFDPLHDEVFHAEKGQGAFLNNYKIKTADRNDDVMFSTSAPRKWKDSYKEVFRALERVTSQTTASIRSTGSAALDLAYVAAGRFDGMWYHQLQWWDISAGALLVREAGGVATSLKGDELQAGEGSLLAASQPMHSVLVKLVCE